MATKVATSSGGSDARERDRYAYWHEVICRFYARAEAHRNDRDQPFFADFERRVLGTLTISDIRCAALRYDRRSTDLRLDPNEDFLLTLMLDGQACLEQDGRLAMQNPGDMVLYSAAHRFDYNFIKPYRILLVRIPRRTLLSRLPDAERMTAVALGSDSYIGSMAARLMRSASTMPNHEETGPAAKVGTSMLELISAAFEVDVADRRDLRDRQAALLHRAKEFMQTRLDDPDLEVESIANSLHVSQSTLSRAFASEGNTVMRYLWKLRLDAGHMALQEGRVSRVVDIALGCGFVSASHFSRMFKDTYGVLPHTLLRGNAAPD
ncbi:MAG: helix-turn-helix domain-containing protein [Burkholderiaceae bacterium]|nr:helix-turn-helix domain-containing protein [Burkholderiaceae bacterium]